jgi:hypothetical protein
MSSVAHWPTEYSAGTGNASAAQVKATGSPSNGLTFIFEATDKSRPAADYSWSFPGASTVDGVTTTTKAASQGPTTVVYAAAGAKTATLTVAAGAGPPAGGAYPVVVTAVAGPR